MFTVETNEGLSIRINRYVGAVYPLPISEDIPISEDSLEMLNESDVAASHNPRQEGILYL